MLACLGVRNYHERMPVESISVESLFESETFGQQLTEWQRARLRADDAYSNFYDDIAQRYLRGSWSGSDHDAETMISYWVEMSDDEFEERGLDAFDTRTFELSRRKIETQAAHNQARETLVDIGRDRGLHEFALYGLDLYLRRSDTGSAVQLQEDVKAVESDFRAVDQLIRRNAGKVLTILGPYLQAGIVGENGISLDERTVRVPIVEGTQSFHATVYNDMPEINAAEQPMTIRASNIHSILGAGSVRATEDWSEMLDPESVYGPVVDLTLVFGSVVEGPPVVRNDQNEEFYRTLFERVRTIGTAASHQVASV